MTVCLNFEYEGTDGSAATWAFDGMKSLSGEKMAAASAQTDNVPEKCLVCGVEKKDGGTQTESPVMRSMVSQTVPGHATVTIDTQTEPQQEEITCHQLSCLTEILGSFADTTAAKGTASLMQEKLEAYMRKARDVFEYCPEVRDDFPLLAKKKDPISTKVKTKPETDIVAHLRIKRR